MVQKTYPPVGQICRGTGERRGRRFTAWEIEPDPFGHRGLGSHERSRLTSASSRTDAAPLRAFDADPAFSSVPSAQVADRTILVAEDDHACRRALRHYLLRSGYHVAEAATVAASLEAASSDPADLVILDLDLGGGTADALTRLRLRSTVPVIVCSGRATERDRVTLFNLGADDFMSKPYSFAELEARVRAVLRRGAGTPTTTLDHGDLVIDQGTRTVTVAQSVVPMTRKEFDLLAFLAATPGQRLLP